MSDMTIDEAVEALDGAEYREEGSPELFKEMRHSGLVAVFGYSDDNVEFRGAIDDELSAYGGTRIYLTKDGLLKNECDNDDCPHFQRMKKAASIIKANWDDPTGYSWTFTTSLPHKTFIVKEDGELFCRGIVFALKDVP